MLVTLELQVVANELIDEENLTWRVRFSLVLGRWCVHTRVNRLGRDTGG